MGWPRKPLESLCVEFTDGNWVESKDQSPSGIRLIQTGNVGDGKFKNRPDKSRYISVETFSKLKGFEIYGGDCLVSRLPDPVGRACVLPVTSERMITAVDCTVLRFDSEQVLPEFFNYFSQSRQYLADVDGRTSGATRKRISRKNLGKVEVPVPPLPEQKRIVAILDQAFADIDQARALTEQNLKNARELFESALQQVFSQRGEGWEDRKLGDVCLKIQDGAHHSPQKLYTQPSEGKFLYITSKNIRNNYMDLAKVHYVDADYHESIYRRCPPELGDVLLTKDGANTGNVTQNALDEQFSLLSSVCLIKTDRNTLNPAFLKFYIQSPMGFKNITGQMTGAAIKRIILKTIKASTIPIPALSNQDFIVEKFDNLLEHSKELEVRYSGKLDALDELKKSLLQKAFSGELT